MEKIRDYKLYKISKRIFFTIIYIVLKNLGTKNRKYFYSKWIVDNGEQTLLTKYPLNTRSLVIDVGGYTGNFSDKIVTLFNPHLIILEPVKKYFNILKRKYSNNKNVILHNYGISNKNSLQKIYLSADGTSLIKRSGKTEKIKLINAASFLKNYRHVDLLSINIEGAEYDVMERIIETGMIKKIKYLQVQFHSFVPDANNKRNDIVKNISKTHDVHFSYPFVWESFKLKGCFLSKASHSMIF